MREKGKSMMEGNAVSSRVSSDGIARLLLCVVWMISVPAVSAERCSSEEAQRADRELWLNKRDVARAIQDHAPWGLPKPAAQSTDRVLVQRDYLIGYSDSLLVPMWTTHRIDTKKLDRVKRKDCFRRDPRIPAPDASLPSDYDEPIYDQGHLTPNGDMSSSLRAVLNSFVMSNMAPQHCFFNRGVWQILESLIRIWAESRETLYITTGSIFDRNSDGRPDMDEEALRMTSRNKKSRVAVPSHFYKVIIHQMSDGTVNTLAFVLPNDDADLRGEAAISYLNNHLVSIKEIETLSNRKLFPDAPPAPKANSIWPFQGAIPNSLAINCRH